MSIYNSKTINKCSFYLKKNQKDIIINFIFFTFKDKIIEFIIKTLYL